MITRNGKIVPFFFGCRRPRFINPHLLRHPRVARDAPILASDLETTGFLPPILDQGQLGSCTCNAKAVQFYFAAAKAGLSPVLISRLMLYYMVRDEEGTVTQDAGAEPPDVMDVLTQNGCCPETEWPYDIYKFDVKPPGQCYTDALQDAARQSRVVAQTLQDIAGVLTLGYPVSVAIQIYDSFPMDLGSKTPIPVPDPNKEQCKGGHDVTLTGYQPSTGMFKLRNSWWTDWGDKGRLDIPARYVLDPNLASCVDVILNVTETGGAPPVPPPVVWPNVPPPSPE